MLKALLRGQRTASLATLHWGERAVSMVAYAGLAPGARFVIHVSGLTSIRDEYCSIA